MFKMIVDIGNTNIKCGLFKNNNLIKTIILQTKQYSQTFIKTIISKSKVTSVYIGSVVKNIGERIAKDVYTSFKIKAKVISTKDFDSSFVLSPFNKKEIGLDILAFALFIKNKYKSGVGISFGTATFAVAVNNKKIEGVVIAPSILLGIHQLSETTSLINTKGFGLLKNQLSFGKNTNQSLASGASHMARGFISSIQEYATKHYKINKVYISGGKSHYLQFTDKMNNVKTIDEVILLGYNELIKTI
ncbi:MAG: type III pantothenate kinase [Mycoplasmataceae bacterium]|jgi:type III pantothenate kinase|nr:type III pantothenate kinase [Mycoplasmataceae bacterium]